MKWQVEEELKEQWEGVKKMEERLEQKKVGQGVRQVDALQKVPAAYQRMSQCKKAEGLDERDKVRGWATEEMKNKSSSLLVEDTEEMIGWRAMSQLDVNECWTKIAGKIEEEVLAKYRVENSKREAYRGRGVPLECGD